MKKIKLALMLFRRFLALALVLGSTAWVVWCAYPLAREGFTPERLRAYAAELDYVVQDRIQERYGDDALKDYREGEAGFLGVEMDVRGPAYYGGLKFQATAEAIAGALVVLFLGWLPGLFLWWPKWMAEDFRDPPAVRYAPAPAVPFFAE